MSTAERMALLSQLERRGKGGIRDRVDTRNKQQQAEMIANMLNKQEIQDNQINMDSAVRSGKQSDLLFDAQFKQAKAKLDEQKKKDALSATLDSYGSVEEAVQLYGITRDDKYIKGAIEKLSQNGQEDLIPILEGIAKGDQNAAQVFKVQRNGVMKDAYDLGVRERPDNLEPEFKLMKSKENGELHYVNINDPTVNDRYTGDTENVTKDYEQVLKKGTNEIVVIDGATFDPELHNPIPKGAKPQLRGDGTLFIPVEDEAIEARKQELADIDAQAMSNAVRDAVAILDANSGTFDLDTVTGIKGGLSSFIAGSDRKRLEAALTTMKGLVGFSKLQAMRNASPTGGALGSVPGNELDQLNAALGNFDPCSVKDPQELKAKVLEVQDLFNVIVHGSKGAANNKVILNHPTLGEVTEADIQTTMKNHNLTREQVLERLQNGG